jgi:diguanylate cyclase (GGDEF)-like protein
MTSATPAVFGARRSHRPRAAILAALGLAVLLATLALAVVAAQQQSRALLRTNFTLRGTSSATLVSTYIAEQAQRERQTAKQFLSGAHVSTARFGLVVASFGGQAAGLLDSSGRLLGSVPSAPQLIGQQFTTRYRLFESAEKGKIVVSNVVRSAIKGIPVLAVAVPYATPFGRRVLGVAYRSAGASLDAFVDHAIAYRQHEVFLIDQTGEILAASPRTGDTSLSAADPHLARAAAHSGHGPVSGAGTPTTFTRAAVPGTPWSLVIAVPNSKLYESIAGWTQWLPWVVFALVALLGMLLVGLFARSLTDRARLATLSAAMERTAQTDSLTGLYNRRALAAHITRIAAQARRREEPMSVLMIDLDRFKRTNDTFGHDAGDQVLCAVADCMREVLRADDVYGRWGGDEFVAVLPATGVEAAQVTIGRLRDAARAVDLRDIGLQQGIPLSAGAATGVHTSIHDLINTADLALYQAKSAIRDPRNLRDESDHRSGPAASPATSHPSAPAPPVRQSGDEHHTRRAPDVPAPYG